jgi:hypothetical protein
MNMALSGDNNMSNVNQQAVIQNTSSLNYPFNFIIDSEYNYQVTIFGKNTSIQIALLCDIFLNTGDPTSQYTLTIGTPATFVNGNYVVPTSTFYGF